MKVKRFSATKYVGGPEMERTVTCVLATDYDALLALARRLRSELLHMCGHTNFMPDEVAMLMSDSAWLEEREE